MRYGKWARMILVASSLALAVLFLSTPAVRAGENTGRISLNAGFDFTTAYYFRGIRQEDQGFIAQPYADMAINLYEGLEGLNSIGAVVGIWNSIHSGPTGADGSNADPEAWYEFDFYGGFTVGFLDNWEAGVLYTIYTSPNGFFESTQEVSLSLAFDDSDLLGDFSLSPYILTAIEVQGGGADAQQPLGVYVELGVEPGVTLIESEDYPVSLSIPLTLGLSAGDYYQDPVTGRDNGFGYFDAGLVFTVPLAFMPADFGSWEAYAAGHFLFLGSSTEALNLGDNFKAIGTFGISMAY